MTHASGRPVMALMLAEQHGNVELYREASRFVLDQRTWIFHTLHSSCCCLLFPMLGFQSERSRTVLIPASWDKDEMDTLDESTQLKLSQRRGWFLERLIKLGTIDVKREYTCVSCSPTLLNYHSSKADNSAQIVQTPLDARLLLTRNGDKLI